LIERETLIPDLMVVLTKLLEIVQAENIVLVERRPSELAALLPEKLRLARVYAQMSRALKQDREILTEAGADAETALKELAGRFNAALEEQRARLEVAKDVTEGVIAAIGRAVVEQRQPVLSYDEDANLHHAISGGASFAVNQDV
jgi:ElaB/YqjD/DUF883 family membrane-anchored ribosome-binding protein